MAAHFDPQNQPMLLKSQVWWYVVAMLVLRRWRKEDPGQ